MRATSKISSNIPKQFYLPLFHEALQKQTQLKKGKFPSFSMLNAPLTDVEFPLNQIDNLATLMLTLSPFIKDNKDIPYTKQHLYQFLSRYQTYLWKMQNAVREKGRGGKEALQFLIGDRKNTAYPLIKQYRHALAKLFYISKLLTQNTTPTEKQQISPLMHLINKSNLKARGYFPVRKNINDWTIGKIPFIEVVRIKPQMQKQEKNQLMQMMRKIIRDGNFDVENSQLKMDFNKIPMFRPWQLLKTTYLQMKDKYPLINSYVLVNGKVAPNTPSNISQAEQIQKISTNLYNKGEYRLSQNLNVSQIKKKAVSLEKQKKNSPPPFNSRASIINNNNKMTQVQEQNQNRLNQASQVNKMIAPTDQQIEDDQNERRGISKKKTGITKNKKRQDMLKERFADRQVQVQRREKEKQKQKVAQLEDILKNYQYQFELKDRNEKNLNQRAANAITQAQNYGFMKPQQFTNYSGALRFKQPALSPLQRLKANYKNYQPAGVEDTAVTLAEMNTLDKTKIDQNAYNKWVGKKYITNQNPYASPSPGNLNLFPQLGSLIQRSENARQSLIRRKINQNDAKDPVMKQMADRNPLYMWDSQAREWTGPDVKGWNARVENLQKRYQRKLQNNVNRLNTTTNEIKIMSQVPAFVKDIVQANAALSRTGFGKISQNSPDLYAGRWIDPVTRNIRVLPPVNAKYLNPLDYNQKKAYLQGKILNHWNNLITANQQFVNFNKKYSSQDQYKTKVVQKWDKSLQAATTQKSKLMRIKNQAGKRLALNADQKISLTPTTLILDGIDTDDAQFFFYNATRLLKDGLNGTKARSQADATQIDSLQHNWNNLIYNGYLESLKTIQAMNLLPAQREKLKVQLARTANTMYGEGAVFNLAKNIIKAVIIPKGAQTVQKFAQTKQTLDSYFKQFGRAHNVDWTASADGTKAQQKLKTELISAYLNNKDINRTKATIQQFLDSVPQKNILPIRPRSEYMNQKMLQW